MSGAADLAVRAALDRAEAADTPEPDPGVTPVGRRRGFAARNRPNGVEHARAGILALSAFYLRCGDRHEERADRIKREAGP